ncbi:MAG: large conductance mechanosensitive channel protein MscL, partial [Clostridia bacterium]|nr:large conductance mechanosensitive channel protein MscL [Clostridia bacterium]
MKKIFQEFKAFITRGNVVDLAVGMIVGAAFTAIVTALVNNIFKPLINAIPMEGVEGLITMLVPRNAEGVKVAMDSTAIDLSQSVYIDWGAFIMAIVNFLLTAVVLFSLVKVINKFRDGMGGMKNRAELIASLTNEEKATCRNAMLPSRKELKAIVAEREAKAAEEA